MYKQINRSDLVYEFREMCKESKLSDQDKCVVMGFIIACDARWRGLENPDANSNELAKRLSEIAKEF